MRALISVHDKTGLTTFARALVELGWQIVASGGTEAALVEAGVPVTAVEDVTGSPEMLGGRVKTLHPRIHAGILARGQIDEADLETHGIEPFDLVVCNLYQFQKTVDDGAGEDEIIEMIDIGGPAMIRAAAKNHRRVGVVVSPGQYDEVVSALRRGGLDDVTRRRMAAEAFFHTAAYDAAIVRWIGPDIVIPLRHSADLRYGENPHQSAALYSEEGVDSWWSRATIHQGKEMSFNNYIDTEAAWRLASDLGPGSAVVVKHTNACGAARARALPEAFRLAWEGDPLSAFGGVVALAGEVDPEIANEFAQKFVEVVIAESVAPEALRVLAAKKGLRVLTAPHPVAGSDLRGVEGGALIQTSDGSAEEEWKTVSEREPSELELESLRFAWKVVASVKSNAIVLAIGQQAVGIGSGDQSRVGAAERAVAKAAGRAKGGVAASDAFFPFRDGIDVLAEAGVTAVVEPGGSRNDAEVIDAANEHGIALVFTGVRRFRH